MALEHSTPSAELTIGPILYNWRPERWRDFYFRVADEAPVSIVYLGEVICSKRSPLFTPHFGPVVNRLENNGKTVVFSTLAEVVTKHDRQLVESVCAPSDALIEANDVSAMAHLRGRRYHAGPHINVYNEQTLAILASEGAQSVCLPPELPATALSHYARTLRRSVSRSRYRYSAEYRWRCRPVATTRVRTVAPRTVASLSARTIRTV
jgi:collagenase-like PrtC family protease